MFVVVQRKDVGHGEGGLLQAEEGKAKNEDEGEVERKDERDETGTTGRVLQKAAVNLGNEIIFLIYLGLFQRGGGGGGVIH